MFIAMKKFIGSTTVCCILGIAAGAFYFSDGRSNLNVDNIEHNEAALPSAFYELQSILAIEDLAEKTQLLNRFFTKSMQQSSLETLALITNLKKLDDRQLSYDVALALWFKIDNEALALWLENEPARADLDPALNNLLIATNELKNRLLFADKISTSVIRKQELSAIFNEWLPIDPEQIIRWSTEERKDSNVWLSLAFQLLSKEPHIAAINGLNFLNPENIAQVRIALQAMINNYQFGSIDSDALFALQTIEQYKTRQEAIMALLPLLNNEKHLSLAMISTLLDSLEPGDLKDELHELLALNWADKNPLEAGEFAKSLSGEVRARALSSVVTNWAENDLYSADRWLKNLDGDLDLPSSSIARVAAEKGNVQISDEWIDDILDEEIRDQAIEEVLQSYYSQAPEVGIYHLVYQKNLTVEKKLKLLGEIYPDEFFLSPNQALDDIRRLEGIKQHPRS